MGGLGKLLVVAGLVLVAVGLLLWLGSGLLERVPWFGRLPGDIRIERERWSLYVPITTCLVLSLLLTLLVNLFFRR